MNKFLSFFLKIGLTKRFKTALLGYNSSFILFDKIEKERNNKGNE